MFTLCVPEKYFGGWVGGCIQNIGTISSLISEMGLS